MGKKSLALGRGLSDILKDHSLNSALSNNSQDTQAPQDSDQLEFQKLNLTWSTRIRSSRVNFSMTTNSLNLLKPSKSMVLFNLSLSAK